MLLGDLNAALIVRKMYDNTIGLEVITNVNIEKCMLLPCDLAFCITINEAHGQMVDIALESIYMPDPISSHNYHICALSRENTFKNLKLEIIPKGLTCLYNQHCIVWKVAL